MFIRITNMPDDMPNGYDHLLDEELFAYTIEDAILHAYMTGDQRSVNIYKEGMKVYGFSIVVPTNASEPEDGVWWLCEGEYEVVSP